MSGKGVIWLVAVPLLLTFIGGGIAFWIAMPELYLGQIWVAVGVFLVVVFGWLLRRTRERERITKEGIPGVGRVLEMTETGTHVNNRPLIKVRLQVEAPGIAPFEVTSRVVVPYTSLAAFSSGTIPVVLDRKDHSKVVVDHSKISSLDAAAASKGSGFADASQDGGSAEDRLVSLEKLRRQGLINDAEYEAKRGQILDSI